MRIETFRCLKCGHEWLRNDVNKEKPKHCPKCRTLNWDKLYRVTCDNKDAGITKQTP